MPRYYFHIYDKQVLISDDEGVELASDDAAKREGLDSARDILRRALLENHSIEDCRVEVVDDEGQFVARFWLSELVH